MIGLSLKMDEKKPHYCGRVAPISGQEKSRIGIALEAALGVGLAA